MALRRCWSDISLALLLSLLLASTLSSGSSDDRARRQASWMDQDLNVVLDRLLPNITQQFHLWNVDPLFLGNLHSQDLSDCWLHGLSSAYRSDECYFRTPVMDTSVDTEDSVGNDTTVVINVGFASLHGSCKFYKKILFMRYRGLISMRMSDLTAHGRFRQPMREDANPALDHLDVVVPANMQVEASGSSALSLVLTTVELLYKSRLRQLVRTTLTEKLRDVLGQYVAQITLRDINEAFRLQQPQMLFNASLIHITLD